MGCALSDPVQLRGRTQKQVAVSDMEVWLRVGPRSYWVVLSVTIVEYACPTLLIVIIVDATDTAVVMMEEYPND